MSVCCVNVSFLFITLTQYLEKLLPDGFCLSPSLDNSELKIDWSTFAPSLNFSTYVDHSAQFSSVPFVVKELWHFMFSLLLCFVFQSLLHSDTNQHWKIFLFNLWQVWNAAVMPAITNQVDIAISNVDWNTSPSSLILWTLECCPYTITNQDSSFWFCESVTVGDCLSCRYGH